jgi:chromosome segregation ATPase
MRNGKLFIACLLPAVLAGCVPPEESSVRTSSEPELYALRQENDRLKKRIKELEAAANIQAQRAEDIAQRDKQLSRKVRSLQFEVDRLKEQVKSLSKLPAERDRYKAEADRAKQHVAELELQLRRLQKQQGE